MMYHRYVDDESSERPHRASDVPVDLDHEREVFVRQFLRRGAELTEGLLDENQKLRTELADAESTVRRLKAQLEADDAIRELLLEIRNLEHERKELLQDRGTLEETHRRNALRIHEVEQELADLANLYIASSHLHTARSVRGVARRLGELLEQLVGAVCYAVFIVQDEELRPFIFSGDAPPMALRAGDHPVLEAALLSGDAQLEASLDVPATYERPLAAVPLRLGFELVGVISIVRVLEHKGTWMTVDHELFRLLTSHAAVAIASANLYRQTAGGKSVLDGVTDPALLKLPTEAP